MLINRLKIPVNNKNIISRNVLFDKLELVPERRLTLLVAPAGYGKTTAVFDWLDKCELPAVWLSLNQYNTTPLAFWKYACETMDDVIPGIKRDSEYILASSELLGANVHINMLIDAISAVKSDLVLLIDDVHLITDPLLLKGISNFIEYMPANLHFILVSRTEPKLELAKYRIKWQMQTIDVKDLRFQKDDILGFYQIRGFQLNSNEVDRIEKYTEGWIASLVAIAMAMEKENQRGVTTDLIPIISRNIGQYLKDEVISGWSEDKRMFAMKTSILDTMSEDVCDTVTGDGNGRRILAELYRDNGFLAVLDEDGKEYRFHYIFKELLYKLLMDTDLVLVSELHARAGFWYKEHGITERAIDHFLSAGLYEEALELFESKDVHYYDYDKDLLISWIERLPKPLRDKSFKAAYVYAQFYTEHEQYDLVRVWGERMCTLAALPEYSSNLETTAFCGIACAFVDANLLIREGNPGFFTSLMKAFKLFDARYYKMPDFVDFNPSDIYYHRCPTSMLIRFFDENEDIFENYAQKFRTFIKINPGFKPLVVGERLYETNKQEEALPYLLEAMEEARAAGCPGALVPAMVCIARIRRAAADYTGAFHVLSECGDLLKDVGNIHWKYLISAFRCRLSIELGNADEIVEWLSFCKLDIYAEINRIREFEQIVYSRALIFKDNPQDADILLQRILAFTEKENRFHSMVEVLGLLALLSYKKGEWPKAAKYLDRSLSVGRERKYVRSYLDEGEAMMKLLSFYCKRHHDISDEKNYVFAASLLGQMKKQQKPEPFQNGILGSLSVREREVLALLIEAYTNKEISSQMGISLQTVKIHIVNIYGKLGIKSRAQCIKLVGELQQTK